METILSGAGQPIVVGGHDKHHHNSDNLIASGQMHDAFRHNDACVRDHALHNDSSMERFGLKTLDELCDVRRELSEVKHDLAVKVIEDGQKTRDLLREQELLRLRDNAETLRSQLIAAGIVPAG